MARARLRLRRKTPSRGAGRRTGRPLTEGGREGPGPATVLQGGRRKAYRPLPPEEIAAAVAAALDAYERDDWFEAHELLEPAWMGTREPGERDLYQGLIKVAAACVHRVRGRREGMTKNLRGARERLDRADPATARRYGIHLGRLLREVGAALDELASERPLGAVRVPRLR